MHFCIVKLFKFDVRNCFVTTNFERRKKTKNHVPLLIHDLKHSLIVTRSFVQRKGTLVILKYVQAYSLDEATHWTNHALDQQ